MATTVNRTAAPDDQTESAGDPLVSHTKRSAPSRLDILDDPPTRSILAALSQGPRRGRALTDTCDSSRSTIYRRLDRLQAAGFLTTETVVDPDGHQCKVYKLKRDRLTVHINTDGLTVIFEKNDSMTA